MSSLPNVAPTLADHLSGPIEVGDPDTAHGLTVYPLFGPPAALDYAAYASVHDQVAITELDGGASVNDLTVKNDGGRPVLLYEGEEILGVPVLVRGAVAAGIDGLFLECHDDPDHALSDGPNNLDLKDLPKLLRDVLAIRKALGEP